MEYSAKELETLNLLKRTDFKNLNKNEIVSFVSKLGEMRPEVAKEIIAQFPELAGFMKTALIEYKEVLENVLKSDDLSIGNYYEINSKGIDGVKDSREYYKSIAEKTLSSCEKLLENPDLSVDETLKIINQQKEILELVKKHDEMAFEQEKYYEEKANEKDKEKRQFDWKVVGTVSCAILTVAAVTVAALTGGNVNIKLPDNSK